MTPSVQRYLAFPVAILLIVASLLKIHELSSNPLSSSFVFGSRSLTIAVASIEILIAFWLVLESWTIISRIITMVLFMVFALFSGYLVLSGETNCHCFGPLAVAPATTLFIDLLAIIAVWNWDPNEQRYTRKEWCQFSICLVISFLAAAVPIYRFHPNTIDQMGFVVGNSKSVFLQPESWIGKRFPLLPHIRNSFPLTDGRWTGVLHRADCPKCEHLISTMCKNAGDSVRRVFVEIPPASGQTHPDVANCLWTSLSDEYDWFVDVPTIVEIDDSTVVEVITTDFQNVRMK